MAEEKSVKIRPVVTIVCDDIRMENNGKPILIGIYLGGMILSGVVPDNSDDVSNLSVVLWMLCEATEVGVASFEVKIICPNPKHKLRIKAKVGIPNLPQATELIPLTLGAIPLKLWQDGDLQILFKHEDEADYQTLRIIPVKFDAIEASAANPQFSSIEIERPS